MVITLGLVLGSFYNVVAYRVPRRESVAYPPSHCPQCQHRLGALELVPVLSYAALRGHCRHCGSGIPFRYPLVEALTGALFWWGYRAYGLTAQTPLFWVLSSLALVLVLVFLERHDRHAVQPQAQAPVAVAPYGPAKDEGGFTLLEVLAALMVLGLVAVAAVGLYGASARAQKQASILANATGLGQSVMEGAHYAASLGALDFVPVWVTTLPVEKDGTTYHVTVQVQDQATSDTLKRVEVTVAWDQPTSSSVSLVTLMTEAALPGTSGNGPPGGGNPGGGTAYGHASQDQAWEWLRVLAQ